MKKIAALLLLLLLSISTYAQDLSLYKKETFITKGDTLKYRILYPKNFDANKKYPVILFLHGRGESGNDNERQLANGGKLFLNENFRDNNEVITIFPQCSQNSYWANVEIDTVNTKRFFTFVKGGEATKSMDLVLQFTNQFFKNSFVDPTRIYVGGLSMGGMGTFEILRRKPKTFAAAFAICGGDNVKNVKKYKHIPLWIFHGGLDDVVTPQFSHGIYRERKKIRQRSQVYTIFKGKSQQLGQCFCRARIAALAAVAQKTITTQKHMLSVFNL